MENNNCESQCLHALEGASREHILEESPSNEFIAVSGVHREASIEGTQIPSFNIGTHVPKTKKHVRTRKKEVGGEKLKMTVVHGAFTSSENINEVGVNEGSSKRKVWDTNVIMEDSIDDIKRLCAAKVF